MGEIINIFHAVSGGYSYMALLFISLLFLYVRVPDKRVILVYPNVVFIAIFFNPILKIIIEKYFLGGGVYWRLWWLIPVNFIISVVCVYTEDLLKKRVEKVIGLTAMCLIIILSGRLVFNEMTFVRSENRFKLPNEILEVSTILEDDLQGKQPEEHKIVATYEVAWRIRMYNPELYLTFGRYPTLSQCLHATDIYELVNAENVSFENLHSLLEINDVQYLILENRQVNVSSEEGVGPEKLGYVEIGRTETYCVFRTNIVKM